MKDRAIEENKRDFSRLEKKSSSKIEELESKVKEITEELGKKEEDLQASKKLLDQRESQLNRLRDECINRGVAHVKKGQYDQAISDFTMVLEINPLEINPKDSETYYNRGINYYFKREYDKSWEDMKKAQDLGYQIPSKFLDDLRKASGRQN